jgi:hypothetical protein
MAIRKTTTATTTKPASKKAPATKPASRTPRAPRSTWHADVAPLISNEGVAGKYIHRIIAGHNDFDVYENAMNAGMNVLLEGPTGAGKTMSVQAFAESKGMPFYAIPSHGGAEASQLFGMVRPVGNRFTWVDGPVTRLVRHGGVLLINEMNFFPAKVQAAMFSLLDARRTIQLLDNGGEVIKAHPKLFIIGDMNPGYEGTRELNQAFRNRFALKVQWDYDSAVEAVLVKSGSLLLFAKQVRDQIAAGEVDTPVGTNMLVDFERIASVMGVEFAAANMVNAFTPYEREAVRRVLEMHTTLITAELDPSYVAPSPEVAAEQSDEWGDWEIQTECDVCNAALNDQGECSADSSHVQEGEVL